jgi:hypothetical protein
MSWNRSGAMTDDEKLDEEVRRIAALPDDDRIEEIARIFSTLTPDQKATVRALMLESDERRREAE